MEKNTKMTKFETKKRKSMIMIFRASEDNWKLIWKLKIGLSNLKQKWNVSKISKKQFVCKSTGPTFLFHSIFICHQSIHSPIANSVINDLVTVQTKTNWRKHTKLEVGRKPSTWFPPATLVELVEPKRNPSLNVYVI